MFTSDNSVKIHEEKVQFCFEYCRNESFLKNQDTSFNHTMNRISSNGAPSPLATKKLTI